MEKKHLAASYRHGEFVLKRQRPDMGPSSKLNNLPKEMMAEIMSRLQAESLMQFKLVNKSFYALITSLIKDPEFVAKHLKYSQLDNVSSCASFVIFRLCLNRNSSDPRFSPKERIVSLLTLLSEEDNKKGRIRCAIEDLNLPFNSVGENSVWFSELNDYCSLEAYQCNGTICLLADEGTITLCNPARRKYKTFSICQETADGGILGQGFGWDSKANKHKFVRISGLPSWIAEVYDFGDDQSWREISVTVDEEIQEKCWYLQSHVYFKGTCYWLLMMGDDPMDMVLTFDVSSEVFNTVLLPDDLHKVEGFNLRLTVWNGSVCLFLYPEVPKGSPYNSPDDDILIYDSIQMWIMDVYDDAGDGSRRHSWRRFLTVKPLQGVHFPLTFWKDNELLMEAEGKKLKSYNLVTRKLRNVSLRVMEMEKILHSGVFVKSLGFLN